jgi:very-short-patch-repair endonuclease
MPATPAAGLPRVPVPAAVVNAATWATSDRQAVLLLCLVLQQRLTTPDRLHRAWLASRNRMPGRRRRLLSAVVGDLCDGVHSLGELDFAAMCRAAGLTEPTRQVVRTHPGGRVYLDVVWEELGLVVEVDGGHHALALNVVDDALRQNELVLGDERVLRVPVIGLRLLPERFMAQVARAHAAARRRAA